MAKRPEPPERNGWPTYAKLVMATLERHEEILGDLRAQLAEIKVQLAHHQAKITYGCAIVTVVVASVVSVIVERMTR